MIFRILTGRVPTVLADLRSPENLSSYLEDKEQVNGFNRKSALRFLAGLSPHRVVLFTSCLFLIISILTTLLSPRIVGYIVDDALIPGNARQFLFLLGVYGAVECVRLVSLVLQNYFFNELGQRVMQDLRVQLISNFVHLPLRTLDKIPAGNLVSRLTDDIKYLAEMFQSGLIHVMQEVLTVFAIIVAMFIIDWRLATVCLVGLPVAAWCAVRLVRTLLGCHRSIRRFSTGYVAFLTDALSGAAVVRLNNKQKQFSDDGHWLVSALVQAQIDRVQANSIFHPLVTLLNGVGLSLLFLCGYYLHLYGNVELGIVVTFVTYSGWILWPIVQAVNKFDIFLSGFASLERIFDALSWESEETNPNADTCHKVEGRIVFKDVWFAYKDEEWVLKGVNFTVEPGESLGVVGPTGSGKSTLISLLLRFYEPQKGEIFIDDINIREIPRSVVRSRLGLILQESHVMDGTIADNITFWDYSRRERLEEMQERSIFKGLGDFSKQVRNSADELSAGAQQLLSFARCFYRDPDVWILDEATAHVDPYLDCDINQLLAEAASERTRIIIAHRLSSVQHTSKIAVLSNGELVEYGSHEELQKAEGLYAAMWKAQASLLE